MIKNEKSIKKYSIKNIYKVYKKIFYKSYKMSYKNLLSIKSIK